VTAVQRSRDWFRARPRALDAAIVVLLLLFSLDPLVLRDPRPDEHPANALAVVLFVGSIVPIIWRKTRPLPVLVTVGAMALVYETIDFPDSALNALSALLAIYAVGAYTDRRQSYVGAGIAAVLVGLILAANWDAGAELANVIANYVIFGTAWVAGDNIRQRRERVKALEDRAVLAEASKTEEAHRAVAAERTRIARELHDVVAHSVSVMVVQAGAARRMLQREDPDPARAIEALGSVETTGRESLTELRRLLGVF
jgi:signal transduction histidine kinase